MQTETLPEFVVFLGQSGCGKTTTLRAIAGLETIDSGDILIGGEPVQDKRPEARDVAFVFQSFALYPHLTVYENMAFPLRAVRTRRDEVDRTLRRVADVLQIGGLLRRRPSALSGGELQRVSIGRAIVHTPQVFLMDEPLSALDAKLREALRAELKDLQMTLGETLLFVSHDQVEAMTMGNRIGVLNRGALVQVGTPQQIYRNPCNSFVARAAETPAMNLLAGRISGGVAELGDGVAIPHPGGTGAEGRALTLGVRPEDLQIASGAPATALVKDIENHGVENIITMTAGPHRLRATVPVTLKLAVGDRVQVGWDARVVLFDAATGASLQHGG